MFNEIATLIKNAYITNEFGDTERTQVRKEVFVKVKSIGMQEKYQALNVGLQPELKLVLADYYDYSDEQQVEYNSVIYDVIRTYRTGIELEVVIARANA